jgi:hypothetical protein
LKSLTHSRQNPKSGRLKKFLQYFMLLFGCLHFVGGPLALLQVIAWGNMIAQYSGESGIIKGVQDTFSGERPCHLCCKISQARDNDPENKKPVIPNKAQGSLKCLTEMIPLHEESLSAPLAVILPANSFVQPLQLGSSFESPPPSPPPRSRA